jgi:triosephosphate isomerase
VAEKLRPIVIGNWKMNGTAASLDEARKFASLLEGHPPACDTMICPPTTLIDRLAAALKNTPVQVGGQDCHWNASGAHTGDISGTMIKDSGGAAVIVGHSERRTGHAETDDMVRKKAEAAVSVGLTAIICIGETLDQRKNGETLKVVETQLSGSIPASATASSAIIAYEPVWAIGTGLTPTVAEVTEVHAFIRQQLARLKPGEGERMRILYGGSVKPSNAQELLRVPNVNGALVGGASLNAADFMGIVSAYT